MRIKTTDRIAGPRYSIDKERLELMASVMHEVWSDWASHMLHCLETGTYSTLAMLKNKWRGLSNMSYDDLSDNEKDNCRMDAEKVLLHIGKGLPYTQEELDRIDSVVNLIIDRRGNEKR